MGKYFGTDGIRGQFGDAHMNPKFAYRVGSALGEFLKQTGADVGAPIVIGRDTRASGVELKNGLAQGLSQYGFRVKDAGVVPTPAVALAIVECSAAMGIAITASHNPAQDNGIKLFDAKGYKLTAETELEIEALIDVAVKLDNDIPTRATIDLDGRGLYVERLSSLMESGSLDGWSIVLDTANGATHETSPKVLESWGATLHQIGNQPNGHNINAGVGSEYPGALGEAVIAQSATVGIAHDGDGDRFVVCDEQGGIIDGDVLLGIYALHALNQGTLKNQTLVTTIQSNLGLDAAVRAAGGTVERVDIGDRNVAERMRAIGSNIGGENSGHIIFSDHASTGDGLLAAVKLLEVMIEQSQPLSELAKWVELFPQVTKNLKVAEKKPLNELAQFSAVVESVERSFGDNGRVLVRYSGTEPKLRLLVEGKDEKEVSAAIDAIESAARADLNVIDG